MDMCICMSSLRVSLLKRMHILKSTSSAALLYRRVCGRSREAFLRQSTCKTANKVGLM